MYRARSHFARVAQVALSGSKGAEPYNELEQQTDHLMEVSCGVLLARVQGAHCESEVPVPCNVPEQQTDHPWLLRLLQMPESLRRAPQVAAQTFCV